QGESPNWVFITGSALLSVLSVRLGYKLKQVLEAKQTENSPTQCLKANGKSPDGNKGGSCHLHSDDFCFSRYSGSGNAGEISSGMVLAVPSSEFNRENNGVMWSSSPDRLELPQKPFLHQQSNCSDSPCVSESGSDIFTRREVVQKLRHQLKRRDDTILEMQDQIAKLQSSLSAEMSNSSHLQSLLDAANADAFDSGREIQRLRGRCNSNGCNNDREGDLGGSWERSEKIELLKKEVAELKEVIEGKEYLVERYKEQTRELSLTIQDLQKRLDSQLPNII
ncbi:hypothetical protein M569_04291, partial [Genlisea aurea]